MSVQAQLQRFMRERLSVEVGADDMLLDRGILDSMGLMEIIMFIEEEIGVTVPDEELVPDNFRTLTSIESLIGRLAAESSSAPLA